MNDSIAEVTDRVTQVAGILDDILVPLLLIEVVWLWRRGHLRRSRVREMIANALTVVVAIPVGLLGLALWDAVFGGVAGLRTWSIPTTWWSALIAVVLADFIFYWQHRWEHERRLLWDLYHSVHHSSPIFDQTTSLRLGMFDVLFTSGVVLPMIAVGFSPTLSIAAMAVSLGYQTWVHTEVIDRLPRWFEAVFNTPSHHRVHHGVEEHYLDTNYGGIFIVWDRWFGTFQEETVRPTYGLTTQVDSPKQLDIQFFELRRLAADLRGDTSWGIRARRLWNGPGWEPVDRAEPVDPIEVAR